MSKLSTKLKQKQSIVPQQIIKSRLLELSIEELEKDILKVVKNTDPKLVYRLRITIWRQGSGTYTPITNSCNIAFTLTEVTIKENKLSFNANTITIF